MRAQTGRRWTGSVSAETLFLVAIGSLLLFGSVELGRGIALRHSLDTAVGLAARYLALNPSDYAGAQAILQRELAQTAGVTASQRDEALQQLAVCDADAPACQPGPAMPNWTRRSYGSLFVVRTQATWQPGAAIPFLPLAPRALAVEHLQVVERFP